MSYIWRLREQAEAFITVYEGAHSLWHSCKSCDESYICKVRKVLQVPATMMMESICLLCLVVKVGTLKCHGKGHALKIEPCLRTAVQKHRIR